MGTAFVRRLTVILSFLIVFTFAIADASDCPDGETIIVSQGESIQAAVDAASPGDTIMVEPGVVYYESVVIETDCLTLSGGWDGGSGDRAVMDGTGAGENAFEIHADRVKITGFEIRSYNGPPDCSKVLFPSGRGVCTGNAVDAWNDESDYGVVERNYIHEVSWSGVFVGNLGSSVKTGWRIEDNVIEGTGHAGIRLTNCSDCRAEDNRISTGFHGVTVTAYNEFPDAIEVSGVRVEGNEITSTTTMAAYLDASEGPASLSNVTVEANQMHHNPRGMLLTGMGGDGGTACRIASNRIAHSSFFGILLNQASDNMLSENEIEDSGMRGIVLIWGSSRNLIEENTVVDSGMEGIYIWLSGADLINSNNTIRENTVVGSGSDGISIKLDAVNNTVTENNVWGSGSGCDLFWDLTGSGNCWEENAGTKCPDPLPGC